MWKKWIIAGLFGLYATLAYSQPLLIAFSNYDFPLTNNCDDEGDPLNSVAYIISDCNHNGYDGEGIDPLLWNASYFAFLIEDGFIQMEEYLEITRVSPNTSLYIVVPIPGTLDIWVSETVNLLNSNLPQEFNLTAWLCQSRLFVEVCQTRFPDYYLSLNQPNCIELCSSLPRTICVGPLTDSTEVPNLLFEDSLCCFPPAVIDFASDWSWQSRNGSNYYCISLQSQTGNPTMQRVTASLNTSVPAHETLPEDYRLSVYPNPFNPTAMIHYELTKQGRVKLSVYDVSGREVRELVNEMQSAGEHRVVFEGAGLGSGIYFARMETAENVQMKKMMLLK